MDDIEYLEEYENLIMPGGTTGVEEDESSSSIDQDIFENLFDDQSDDDSEVLPKKVTQQVKRGRESLDSLDMLVRDLGEQVNVKNEQQKCRNINDSSPLRGLALNSALKKPITPCLKKSTPLKSSDGASSSQEKPQKRVVFANLPSVKRDSPTSSPSSSRSRESIDHYTISGRKPIDSAINSAETSKSSDSNSQRKPQLTIVKPEKIQFKDPVDDPLSFGKEESDLDALSDVSSDSFMSLGEAFPVLNEPKENDESQLGNSKAEESLQSSQNSDTIQSPPAQISTANLPEKATIISDTILTPSEMVVLTSQVSQNPKELFTKNQHAEDTNMGKESTQTETDKSDSFNANESVANNNNIVPVNNNSGECVENSCYTELLETSATSAQLNETNSSEAIEKSEKFDIQTSNIVHKQNDEVNKDKEDNAEQTEAEISTLPNSDKIKSNESNLKRDDMPLKKPTATNDAIVATTPKTTTEKEDNKNAAVPHINKSEKINLPQTPKTPPSNIISNQKSTTKKLSTPAKPETPKSDKIKSTNASKEQKGNLTPSRSHEKSKEIFKKDVQITVNQPQRTVAESPKKDDKSVATKVEPKTTVISNQKPKEQKPEPSKVSKNVLDSPAKDGRESSQSAKKNSKQESETPTKERDKTKTRTSPEKKVSSNVTSLSSNRTQQEQLRSTSNQRSSTQQNPKKIEAPSPRKETLQTTQKDRQKIDSKKSNDAQSDAKLSRENSNVSNSSRESHKDSKTYTQSATKLSREPSNVSSSSPEKQRTSINPTKVKRDSSVQRKSESTASTQGKVEAKDAIVKTKRDIQGSAKEGIKESCPKKPEENQAKKDLTKKEEIKSTKSKKTEDLKTSTNVETKTGNSKMQKETDISKSKTAVQSNLKGDKSTTSRSSREDDDTKSKIQPGKNVSKVNAETKSHSVQNSGKPTSNDAITKTPSKSASLGTNTSSNSGKRSETGRPTLKRGNSSLTDDTSTKRVKTKSSSVEDVEKPNCNPSDTDVSGNKKEQTLENTNTKRNIQRMESEKVTAMNRKASDTDLKPKETTNKPKTQTTTSKTEDKIHCTDSAKKPETTSTSKDSSKAISTSTLNVTMPCKKVISSSSQGSKKQSTSNEPGTSVTNMLSAKKSNESASTAKKLENTGALKNTQSSNKNQTATEKKPAEKETPTSTADSGESNTLEINTSEKCLKSNAESIVTDAVSGTVKQQEKRDEVSSTFADEANKTNDDDAKQNLNIKKESTCRNIPPSNETDIRTGNIAETEEQNEAEHTKRNLPQDSNNKSKKTINKNSTNSSQDKITSTTAKDQTTSQSNESKSCKSINTARDGNKTVEKVKETTDSATEIEKTEIEKTPEQNEKESSAQPVDIKKPISSSNKKDKHSSKDDDEIAVIPPKESLENTKDPTENESKTENVENQSTNETIEAKPESMPLNVGNQISSRRRTPASERKGNAKIVQQLESQQKDNSMDSGNKRQMRKRCIEISAAEESQSTTSKPTSDKEQTVTAANPSKLITDTAPVEKQPFKRETNRRKRRGREIEIIETPINPSDDKLTTHSINIENQQDNDVSKKKIPKEQTESVEEKTLPLESQIEIQSATDTVSALAEVQNPLLPPTQGPLDATAQPMEVENERLDSLSSLDSAAFSGFADSPVNVSNNEKSNTSTSSTIALKEIDQSATSISTGKVATEDVSASPKRLKTTQSKASVSSAVITFNEWLARKNNGGQSSNKGKLEKPTSSHNAVKENNKTSIVSQAETNNPNTTKSTENLSETSKASSANSKSNSKTPAQRKSELEVLKESMPKDMRESGIDKIIESHFSAPHCLTKRSLAIAMNENTIKRGSLPTNPRAYQQSKDTSLNRRVRSKKVSLPIAVQSTTILTDVAPKVPPNRVSTKNKRNIMKQPVKMTDLPPKCRNCRIRLSRSVVKTYFKNFKTQAMEAAKNSQPQSVMKSANAATHYRSKARKRKAPLQVGEPVAKKAATIAIIEPPVTRKTTAAQSPKQSQSRVARNASRAKTTTISPKSRGATTTLAAAVDLPPPAALTNLSKSLTTSPAKTSRANSGTELLTPISEAPTVPTVTTDSSRRAKSKRSTATAATTVTTVSNNEKASTLPTPTPTASPVPYLLAKQLRPLPPTPTAPVHANIAPKTECEDEYYAAYSRVTQQKTLQISQTPPTILPSAGPSISRASPALSTDSTRVGSTISSGGTVPPVIPGATSHSLPPIAIDNAGTRIYSFFHPIKYSKSNGFVMLDYCCPNLDGPMTAIDPTRHHAKVDVPVREIPAYITMETRLVTRDELEADSNALPASIRHKVQRITGGNKDRATPKVTASSSTPTSSSTISTNLTSSNMTSTTTVPPKVTTASVSSVIASSTSNAPATTVSVSSAVSASVSALQKQLPATTTLTPKTMPTTGTAATVSYKTSTGNSNSGTAPTATITPTTLTEMRIKLRNNLKKCDLLLKRHYPRISLLTYDQRQAIIESLVNSTQLLPRDIETVTRFLQEYVTHMTLKTASNSQPPTEISVPTTSATGAADTVRATPTAVSKACTTTAASSAILQTPPVTTRAQMKRGGAAATSSNLQRRSVPIYNSDKTIIGYQVQMVATSNAGPVVSTAPTTSSKSFASTTSTRRPAKNNSNTTNTTLNNNNTMTSTTTTTRRSGVFVIDKRNSSAPGSQLLSVPNNASPRMLYRKPDIRTPTTTLATMVHTPQASSTPLSSMPSSNSIVTRSSGGTMPRINRGIPLRQAPTRSAATKMQSPAAVVPAETITTPSSLPRLPTLTRNPHLPPVSANAQATTPIANRLDVDQSILQKRLTRKTALAANASAELVVVNHDLQGNPLPLAEESILPDSSNSSSAALIKKEHPDEF